MYHLMVFFILVAKFAYENTYCNCTAKYGIPPWCGKWSIGIKESFCILNGGLKSKFCPGSKRYIKNGQPLNEGLSSHPSICNKAERRYL